MTTTTQNAPKMPAQKPMRPQTPDNELRPYGKVRPISLRRHRGGLVLTLAILGWATAPFIGLFGLIIGSFALSMSAIDLKKINAGTMDPRGRGLTLTALILSILQMVATIALFLLVVVFAVM
ncbi:hypothetical protein OAU50_06410 [Planctomycetota bacterium]|nr:hypothetical protein [Planctomycetota bacterium]